MAKLSLINRDQKRRALVKKYAKKREELLLLKKQQLAERQMTNPEIERQLVEVREKILAYEAAHPRQATAGDDATAGLVQIGL